MDDGHAKVRMADVRAQLDRTYFAGIGPTERTPNGNDYGQDLLRQHHRQHPC